MEGVGRVRLDEKAGEQREENEDKFKGAFKEVLNDVEGTGRVRMDEQREGREEKYLVDWREMGRCCQENLIFCKTNHHSSSNISSGTHKSRFQ